MVRDTDRDWSSIAESDPYWGVISVDQFRGRDLSAEKKAQFFASGQQYINNILSFTRKYMVHDFQIDRGLDFGCGVGRLLLPLAQAAREAVGVDVAPRMLALTQENLAAAGITNATTVLGTDDLANVEGKFNFINSYIVLQHIPPERGIRIIRELLLRLEVRGVFALHLTYAKERRHRPVEVLRSKYFRRNGNTVTGLVSEYGENPEGTVTMFDYDLNEIMSLVSDFAGEPLIILPTSHDGHIGINMIGIKAREPANA